MINFLSRPKHRPWGSGDSGVAQLLQQHPDPNGAVSREFDLEYRREAFRRAAERVRAAVNPQTWEAFWRSSVLDDPINQVADELSMSTGSVYIARSRVMARLREAVERFEM